MPTISAVVLNSRKKNRRKYPLLKTNEPIFGNQIIIFAIHEHVSNIIKQLKKKSLILSNPNLTKTANDSQSLPINSYCLGIIEAQTKGNHKPFPQERILKQAFLKQGLLPDIKLRLEPSRLHIALASVKVIQKKKKKTTQ